MGKVRRAIAFLLLVVFAGTVHATTLVSDPFTDGSRTNAFGGDARGGVWYQNQNSTASNQLTVVDDSAGIGTGNALKLVASTSGHKVLAFFSPLTLANAGDGIQVTFDYRFPAAPASQSSGLRVGLLNSNGTRQTNDTSSTSTRNDDKGYDATTNPGYMNPNTGFWGEPAGDDILGGTGLISSFSGGAYGAAVNSSTNKHAMLFRITQQANGDLALFAQIDGRGAALGTHPAASVLTYTFDEFAFGFGGSLQTTILMDNVVIKTFYGNGPAVALTSPLVDTVFASPSLIHLTANASVSTGSVTTVEFYCGTTKIGESSSVPYAVDWVSPGSGVWSLTAVAYDDRGDVATSAPVDIRVTGGTPDEFDTLRARWFTLITGGTNYSLADPDIAARVSNITSAAQSPWSIMVKTGGISRAYLWSDLASTTVSSQVSGNYRRLRSMALAYASHGSTLQSNASLLADILGGVDWLNANRYSDTRSEYDNWYDWEISIPESMNDIAVLLYDRLTPTQLMNQMRAIEHYMPDPTFNARYVTSTSANRNDNCDVVLVRGLIVKDGAKMTLARDTLNTIFPYLSAPLPHLASTGEGFYDDGSYIYHVAFPYTGGYGQELLIRLSLVLALINGSSWAITDPNLPNLYQWIYKAYDPFLFRGAMMSCVSGRVVARSDRQEHPNGHGVISSILAIADFAPAQDAACYKAMCKALIQADTSRSFTANASLPALLRAKAVLGDVSIPPRPELVTHRQFPSMDRVVHWRSGFAFAVSMCSSRIYNYESINSENLHGWYQGDGATYLYNSDIDEYGSNYWPTVNSYRLAGITVDTQARSNAANKATLSTKSWGGGVEILGLYGSSGFELQATASTLTARKSWFMFDNEIVALGSGITSTDNRMIETIVENRRLCTYTSTLTVDGVTKPTMSGWNETMSGVGWCNLAATGGYVFPGGANLKGLRETRTGAWYDINSGYSSTVVSNNYVTLWFDHGSNPSGAGYSYILLPNQTATQTAAYAANQDVIILENTAAAHGLREQTLGITAVNFWEDATHTVDFITVDKKSAVIAHETTAQVDVSISDPTQLNTGVVTVELARSATSLVSADAQITILQLAPTIRFTANVNGMLGRTLKASFAVPDTTVPVVAITVPTTNPTFTTTNTLLDVLGTALDNVGVTQVVWSNNCGGSATASTGTGTWNAAAVPLQVGDNVITVTASDAAGNTGSTSLSVKRFTPFEWWQGQNFNKTELADSSISGPTADPDDDGHSNLQEFLAGTDPKDASSALRISELNRLDSGCGYHIGWPSVPGKLYKVLYSDAPGGSWQEDLPYSQVMAGTGQSSLSYTDTTVGSSTKRFYMIKLVVP
jgi:hyaluronate lyase